MHFLVCFTVDCYNKLSHQLVMVDLGFLFAFLGVRRYSINSYNLILVKLEDHKNMFDVAL